MVLFSIQSASEIGRLSPMNIVFFTFTNAIVHWTSLINWFFIKFSCFFYLFYRTIWNEVDYKTIHRFICVWNEYLFYLVFDTDYIRRFIFSSYTVNHSVPWFIYWIFFMYYQVIHCYKHIVCVISVISNLWPK